MEEMNGRAIRSVSRDELVAFFADRDPEPYDEDVTREWAEYCADAFIERFFEGAMLIVPHPLPNPQIINLGTLSEEIGPEHMKLFTQPLADRGGLKFTDPRTRMTSEQVEEYELLRKQVTETIDEHVRTRAGQQRKVRDAVTTNERELS